MNTHEWGGISIGAKHLVSSLLCLRPDKRITVTQALKHPWIQNIAYNAAALTESFTVRAAGGSQQQTFSQSVPVPAGTTASRKMSAHPAAPAQQEDFSSQSQSSKPHIGTVPLFVARKQSLSKNVVPADSAVTTAADIPDQPAAATVTTNNRVGDISVKNDRAPKFSRGKADKALVPKELSEDEIEECSSDSDKEQKEEHISSADKKTKKGKKGAAKQGEVVKVSAVEEEPKALKRQRSLEDSWNMGAKKGAATVENAKVLETSLGSAEESVAVVAVVEDSSSVAVVKDSSSVIGGGRKRLRVKVSTIAELFRLNSKQG